MGADLSMRLGLTNPDQTNNNLALITFGDGTSEPGSGFFGMQFTDHTNNYGELVFGTRGVVGYGEKMRIDSEGNVGIGTTSPNTKLDVNGVVVISPNTDGKNTFMLTTGAAIDDARLLMKSVNTVKVDIQANGDSYFNGGNVGIGTTNPTANLHISDTADAVLKIEGDTINSDETKGPKILLITDNGYRTAAITGGNATYETSSGNFNALNLQSKDIRFHTGTTQDYDLAIERMRITGTGALSFGTTGTAYGTSGQILKSNGNASPTWIDGSAIPTVPGGGQVL